MNRILLDGAMGTMLQGEGMPLGEIPEVYAMNNPEILKSIHKRYLDAGTDIIYSCTFGANRRKFKGTEYDVKTVVERNIRTAKEVAGNKKVALDIGPIGELMKPFGTMSFDEAYDIFKEIIIAGDNAGADLIVLETMTDMSELRAGVLAAKENSKLPVWVSMSFEESGRTFTGTLTESMALTFEGLGIDAIGINCSLGPDEIYPLIIKLREWTSLPVFIKPNAGLPDPKTGKYRMDACSFGKNMKKFEELGIFALGGCCGTTPEYIKELQYFNPKDDIRIIKRNGVCSSSHVTDFDGIRIIGERINPTGKKRFQKALLEHDMSYIMQCALDEEEAGADILDVNVGYPGIDEKEMMRDAVYAIQSVTDLPLQIDSADPDVIEAGLRAYSGKAIVNSVNGEAGKLKKILPLVKKYGAAVIGLTMDEKGIPDTAEERLAIAEKIVKTALEYGIKKEDVIIDCLTLTISAEQDRAKETLKALKLIKDKLGVKTTLGVSNISFGLPERSNVTESFLTQALLMGLDLPIINPNDSKIMDAIYSYRAISGEDKSCEKYIERFGNIKKEEKIVSNDITIEQAILKGLKAETKAITEDLLTSMSEIDVINKKLIPSLDIVGEKYEKGEIFLPQLINSANAACEGFEVIKKKLLISGKDGEEKGKIVVATVEGDIHDIGKNIAKVVLENYGYTVLDLGRDVPASKIISEVKKNDVKLVGLSALMTTTVESMKNTIEMLKAECDCIVFSGGAVLTENYAKEIGADYYAKDAKSAADIAKEVLG